MPPGNGEILVDGNPIHPATIGDAIAAAQNNSLIEFGTGTFSITEGNYPNTFASGKTGLSYRGQGVDVTRISGSPRLLTSNIDANSLPPSGQTMEGMTFFYSGGGDSYILSWGSKPIPNSGAANFTLRRVRFTGEYSGNVGTSGNYTDLWAANDLVLDDVTVELTGQDSYDPSRGIGGSGFLFAQGSRMSIINSSFNERGYSVGVIIFDSSDFLVDNNTFEGASLVKERGETFSNSSGTVSNNSFYDGAYAEFMNVSDRSLSINNNEFSSGSVVNAVGVVFRASSSLADVRGNVTALGNTFEGVIPFVSEFSVAATGAGGINPQLSFATNAIYNPVAGLDQSFQRWIVGGQGNDQLSAGSYNNDRTDFIIGAEGSDSLQGDRSGPLNRRRTDAFAFVNTTDGSVDAIIDFYNSGTGSQANRNDKIWLWGDAFGGLAPGSIGSAFGSTILYSKGTSEGTLSYDADGSGGKSAMTFATLAGAPSLTAADFVVF